jgi:fumarate reductase subunit C
MPIFWWLGKAAYVRFILRELTSLFVAYAAVVLVLQVRALAAGEQEYARFHAWLEAPGTVAFHGFVLLGLLFHSATWFGLAPRALVVRVRGKRVPEGAVLAGHYLAWAAASALLAWAVAGGGP